MTNRNGGTVANGASPAEPDEHELAAERAEARWQERAEQDHGYMGWVAERFERLASSSGTRELWVPPLDDDGTSGGDNGAVPGGNRQSAVPVPSPADVARVLDEGGVTAATILGGIDAAELLSLDLPELKVLVPGLIPEGTTLLIAPPKIGKSVLCFQLAVETALGGVLLGRRVNDGKPGDVLYLALEDSLRRGQERISKVLEAGAGSGGSGGAGKRRRMPPGRLTMAWECPPLGGGLEDVLETWLDEHPNAALIIVDTLGKVRGPGQQGDERRNAYQVDVRDLTTIQRLVLNRGLSLVIVHHTNKGRDDDFVARASGTYGIGGSVDTILSVSRKRNQPVGVLVRTGRDLEEAELAVTFTGLTGWRLADEHEAALAMLSPEAQQVLDVLLANAGVAMTAAVVATALGSGANRRTVAYHLAQLAEEGLATRAAGGYMATLGMPVEGPVH